MVVLVLIVAIVGLVVAQRTTLFILAVLGLIAQAGAIAAQFGVGAAILMLTLTALSTWLYGLARAAFPR
jgi:hypothetical protein